MQYLNLHKHDIMLHTLLLSHDNSLIIMITKECVFSDEFASVKDSAAYKNNYTCEFNLINYIIIIKCLIFPDPLLCIVN